MSELKQKEDGFSLCASYKVKEVKTGSGINIRPVKESKDQVKTSVED